MLFHQVAQTWAGWHFLMWEILGLFFGGCWDLDGHFPVEKPCNTFFSDNIITDLPVLKTFIGQFKQCMSNKTYNMRKINLKNN